MKYYTLGWEFSRNVPLLRGPLRLRRDHWIAHRWETRLFSQLVSELFNAPRIFEDRVLVLHRAPPPRGEYAVEIIGEGLRLGMLEYVAGEGWVLHPSGALASILEYLGVDVAEVEARRRIKGKKIHIHGCRETRWILVASGSHIGPARHLEGCVFKVKDMAPRGFRLLGDGYLKDAVSLNAGVIEEAAATARRIIEEETRGKAYVAFSGGADSQAVLSLAVEALGPESVVAVYVDTGMEFPETRRHVEKISSMLGVDLQVVEAHADPIEEIARGGLPTRSNRWCTRVFKLEPLKGFYEKMGVTRVLEGVRALESRNRAKTPLVSVNPLIPGVRRIAPIRSWPRIMVQLYLAKRNLPVNPLYDKGLTRIGCMICPAMHLFELHSSRNWNPNFYRELAERTGIAIHEILDGTWRFNDQRN